MLGVSYNTIGRIIRNYEITKDESELLKNRDSKRKKIQIPYDEMYALYITQNLSTIEISKMKNVSPSTIARVLKEHNIIKDPIEIIKKKVLENPNVLNIGYDELYDLYINQNLSGVEISKILNFSYVAVFRKLNEYNIKKDKDIITKNRCSKRSKPLDFDYDELYDYYITKNMTIKEIAKLYNKSKSYMTEIFCKYDIKKDHDTIIKKRVENSRNSLLSTHGVCNVFQLDEIKNKTKTTMLEKYGVEHVSQVKEIHDKVINTMLVRHGVKSFLEKPEIREKSAEAVFKKYGVNWFSQLKMSKKYLTYALDKDTFINYITTNTLHNVDIIASELGCSANVIYKLKNKWKIDNELINVLGTGESSYEREICKILDNFNIKYETHDRSILDGKEIDILIPDYNIGIEFNGDYWHCNSVIKDANYHKNKSLEAESNDIFIYHIFEYDWLDQKNKDIIISMLTNLLKKNSNRIHARKCELRKVSDEESMIFINENHLFSGNINDSADIIIKQKINYGLYYNEELVSIVVINKIDDKMWELSKFCNKKYTTVIGGISKLWKYFLKEDFLYGDSVVSFNPIHLGKGNIYIQLGFLLEDIVEPNLVSSFRKNNSNFNKNGALKIYDCGTRLWVYKKE
jgi:transposase